MASFSATEAGGKIYRRSPLLTDVLKGELGFDGFIVSDWQAVDQVDPDYATAVARSINAGIDMVMVPSDYAGFQRVLTDAVAGGTVAEDPDRRRGHADPPGEDRDGPPRAADAPASGGAGRQRPTTGRSPARPSVAR